MKPSTNIAFKAFGYVARPRRTEVRNGVEQRYWTVRCRRKVDPGEWSLGWHPTLRQAERSFHAWVERRRRKMLTPAPQLTCPEVMDCYGIAVENMDKRPNTIANRQYTARQLREFMEGWGPKSPITDFDDVAFGRYLTWLRDVKQYSAQTIENALIGARTFLRWASPTYLPSPPKAPAFHVPRTDNPVVYE